MPKGTYKVTGNLTLSNGSGFTGTPEARIRFDGDYLLDATSRQSIHLSNFTLERNMAANTATQPLIKLQFTHDAVIDRLTILNSRTSSPTIYIRGSYDSNLVVQDSYNLRITNNTIQDYSRVAAGGIGPGSNEGIKGTGISVLVSRNFVVANNRIVETQRYFTPSSSVINYQGSGIAVISSSLGSVTNNTIDYAGQGIDIGGGNNNPLQGASGYVGTSYVTVTGNTIKDIYIAAIKVVNGASYNTISSNVVHRSGLVGIWLAPGTTSAADGTVIKGNIVYANTVIDTGSGPAKDAWAVPGSKRNTGITLEQADSSATRVTQNLIIGNAVIDTKGNMTYGVSDTGVFSTSTPNDAIDNYFFGNYVSGSFTSDFSISVANHNSNW
ncbi:hypothetical protein D3C73_805460 [compost metagenome]